MSVYKVTDAASSAFRIVEAANQAQALRHVMKGRFTATPMTASELGQALNANPALRVEVAKPEQLTVAGTTGDPAP